MPITPERMIESMLDAHKHQTALESIGVVFVHDSVDFSKAKYADIMRVLPVESKLRRMLKEEMFVHTYGGRSASGN